MMVSIISGIVALALATVAMTLLRILWRVLTYREPPAEATRRQLANHRPAAIRSMGERG